MGAASRPPANSPGRPRDPRVEEAVRAAVVELLVEAGYEALSFREVALRAGVGQPTVYRRWATKAELVEFAVFTAAEWSAPRATGNLEKDLARLAKSMLDGLLSPAIHAALPGLILAHYDTPDEHTLLRAWAEAPVLDAFVEIAKAGLSGKLKPADLGAVFESFVATLTFSVLTRDEPTARRSGRSAARIADRALKGLAGI